MRLSEAGPPPAAQPPPEPRPRDATYHGPAEMGQLGRSPAGGAANQRGGLADGAGVKGRAGRVREPAPPPHANNLACVPLEACGKGSSPEVAAWDSGKCSLRPFGWAEQRARIRSLRAPGALEPKLQLPADDEAGLEDREYGGDGCSCVEGPGAEGCRGARGVSPGSRGSQGPAAALRWPAAVQARARALAPGAGVHPQEEGQEPHEAGGAGVGHRLSLRDPPLPAHQARSGQESPAADEGPAEHADGQQRPVREAEVQGLGPRDPHSAGRGWGAVLRPEPLTPPCMDYGLMDVWFSRAPPGGIRYPGSPGQAMPSPRCESGQ
ncbi:collagen alpha-1(I) chain-like [Vombatus ursinus]|uniref:collagen alpha-1(I) chain-like n=1 Tax=Vombatus ursinus TaxID=29139 RepID=UPI000FFD2426|nr:collagen alpha-1(I) chain-like [Vombatus ursinus]